MIKIHGIALLEKIGENDDFCSKWLNIDQK
jgi:hypothetical protein